MLKAVLDTNVLVSGMLSASGSPGRIVNLMKQTRQRQFNVYYNDEIISEYRDVLARGKFHFSPVTVERLFEALLAIGFPVCAISSRVPMPDESDRVFYDVAKASGALLVTGNKKHYPDEPFIITPAEFINFIEAYEI
jgi:putative PIN family toxin of toxin-antitoxin system